VVVSKPPLSIEGRYAVTDTNVFQLSQPGTFADPLTEVLRNGARALLAQAVEAEVATLLSCHADKLTDDGRQRLVRHGRWAYRADTCARWPTSSLRSDLEHNPNDLSRKPTGWDSQSLSDRRVCFD
jgi:hypothetical protein